MCFLLCVTNRPPVFHSYIINWKSKRWLCSLDYTNHRLYFRYCLWFANISQEEHTCCLILIDYPLCKRMTNIYQIGNFRYWWTLYRHLSEFIKNMHVAICYCKFSEIVKGFGNACWAIEIVLIVYHFHFFFFYKTPKDEQWLICAKKQILLLNLDKNIGIRGCYFGVPSCSTCTYSSMLSYTLYTKL